MARKVSPQHRRNPDWRADRNNPASLSDDDFVQGNPDERDYGNQYREVRPKNPNAYRERSVPSSFGNDSIPRESRTSGYWGGHIGAEDRFDSDLTDRYGYGRGDFQDSDIYGRKEYYSEGPQSEYQTRARDRGQNNPPLGHYSRRDQNIQRDRNIQRDQNSSLSASHGYGVAGPDQGAISHRGRGPKGYQRSDERILEDVCELLSDDPMVDASDIEVSCSQGVVTLTGTVENRPRKYRAESLTADVRGVKDIQNDLTVTTGWRGGASGLSSK